LWGPHRPRRRFDSFAAADHLGVVTGEAIIGANAVIGIDLDYEVLGQNSGMLMAAVSGTAVVTG
jgi:Putative heavy-metal-binding